MANDAAVRSVAGQWKCPETAWTCCDSDVALNLDAPKAEKKEDDMDEDDLFGSDEDDDEESFNALCAAKKEAMDKAASKKKVIAKSLIMWEVKPVDSDTNLDDLNTKIKTEIAMDGLKWNTDYKKEPVAFGIFKLIIGACVEDDKVSTDDIEEAITAMDDFVQSLEIVSFNKL
jgi:elongation factor 1-beta